MSWKKHLKNVLLYPTIEPSNTVRVHPMWRMKRLGTAYGGWNIPVQSLREGSICYCIGAGEDITFDLELVKSFGAIVYCYDPTPRAVSHVESAIAGLSNYRFFNVGIWDENRTMKFFGPQDPTHVSHSIVNLQGTDHYFEAECKTLATVLQENGHTAPDLLKLDVEGAEYRILQHLIQLHIRARILCVEFDEFHHPVDADYKSRISAAVSDLCAFGYVLIKTEASNYTFIRSDDFPLVARAARMMWRAVHRLTRHDSPGKIHEM